MSCTPLRSIQERLDRLQTFIDDIAQKAGAVGVKTGIREACNMFPIGRHYDVIVQDLKTYLPETIDSKLRELAVYCSRMVEPYFSHITSEIDGILLELQSFRSSHGGVTAGVVGQHARMPAMVEMRALLGRLDALK